MTLSGHKYWTHALLSTIVLASRLLFTMSVVIFPLFFGYLYVLEIVSDVSMSHKESRRK